MMVFVLSSLESIEPSALVLALVLSREAAEGTMSFRDSSRAVVVLVGLDRRARTALRVLSFAVVDL